MDHLNSDKSLNLSCIQILLSFSRQWQQLSFQSIVCFILIFMVVSSVNLLNWGEYIKWKMTKKDIKYSGRDPSHDEKSTQYPIHGTMMGNSKPCRSLQLNNVSIHYIPRSCSVNFPLIFLNIYSWTEKVGQKKFILANINPVLHQLARYTHSPSKLNLLVEVYKQSTGQSKLNKELA